MAYSLRFAVNCSILFTELPVLQRPGAVRDAGFDGVEFWWPFGRAVPSDREADAFVSAIRDAGVQLVGLNFFAGDMPAGDRGLVSWPGRQAEFRDNVEATLSIGEQLGCRAFNALYGNRLDGVDTAEQDALGLENLIWAAGAAQRIEATVLVEAVSGTPAYPLKIAADALAVIGGVHAAGATGVGLLADLYHLAVNGDDVDAVIAEHARRIAHVQIADAPGRNEPGTGTLPLEAQLTALEAGGYMGWVGLEYKPSAASVDSFHWLARDRHAVDR